MRSKGFTLIEIMLATVLATLLVLGTAAVLNNMQKQSADFKTRIDNDLAWIEANRHMAQNVRASSYLTIPDSNTLILYSYNEVPISRYVGFTVQGQHYMEYQVYNPGNYTYTREGAPFYNVSAAFTAPNIAPNPATKGTKYGKLVEAIITYSTPFTNTLRLRTAVEVKPPTTWARVIGGGSSKSIAFTAGIYGVQPLSSGNYILSGVHGSSNVAWNIAATYLSVIDRNGNMVWEKTYALGSSDASYMEKSCAIEVFKSINGVLVSDGLVLGGSYLQVDHYPFDYVQGANVVNRGIILRTDISGNVAWLQQYGLNTDSVHGFGSIRQTHDLSGFVASGFGECWNNAPAPEGFYWYDAYLGMVNSDGSKPARPVRYFGGWSVNDANIISWGPSEVGVFTAMDSSPSIEYWFDATDTASGYILVGTTADYNFGGPPYYGTGAGVPDYPIYIVKVDNNGEYQWSKAYGKNGSNYLPYSCSMVVNQATGVFDGYIIAGVVTPVPPYSIFTGPTQTNAFLLRLDRNFNVLWLQTYGGAGDDFFHDVKQTIDGGFIAAGYTNSSGAGNFDAWLVKTDSAGTPTISQTYGGAADDRAYAVQQIVNYAGSPEGYLVCGYTYSFGDYTGIANGYIFRADTAGLCPEASSAADIKTRVMDDTIIPVTYVNDSPTIADANDRQNTVVPTNPPDPPECELIALP